MRKNYLQKRVTAGRFTLPVAIIISIVCWTMTSILLPDLPKPEAEYSLLSYLKVNHLSENIALALSLFIFAFIGYSLIILNNAFGIIRMRASVQNFILFLIYSCYTRLTSISCRRYSSSCNTHFYLFFV